MPKLNWISAGFLALTFLAAPADAVTLKYGGAAPPLTMDPHSTNDFVTASFNRQVYDSIVGVDDAMALTPGLATEWAFQPPDMWRLKLRPGVKFHDGSALTADDVVFSIMRQKTSPLYRALFGEIKEAIKRDDTTVDIVSNISDPILPQKLIKLFVMSKAWATANGVEKVPDLGAQGTEAHSLRHANGSGPMKLVSHEPRNRTVFERNRTYWSPGNGNVDEAIYTTVGSAPTRLAALLSGELDLIADLPLQDIERVKTTQNYKIAQAPQQLFMHVEMDGTREVALDVFDKAGNPLKANPLKDVRVRRAFAYAIDAKLLVDRVMRGNGIVIGTGAAAGFAGYQKDLDVRWPTDVTLAKSLLTQAGYPDGFTVQLNCPLERYINAEDVCRAIASMLARIGVEVRVKGMVWPEFARMLVNGPNSSFHLIGGSGNSGDLQDAFVSIMATRDKDKGRGGTNWAMWTNAEFDAVVDELVRTADPARRTELYRKGLSIGRDQVHAVYLYQPVLSWGMKQSVSMSARPDFSIMLQNVAVK